MNKLSFAGIMLTVALFAGGCATYTGAFATSFALLKSATEGICVTTTYIPGVGPVAECTTDVKQISDVNVEVYVQLEGVTRQNNYYSQIVATCRYRINNEGFIWSGGYLTQTIFNVEKTYVIAKKEVQLSKGSAGELWSVETGSYKKVQYCPEA
jgi:hypothetical protein